jgi:hypothetical protein
MGGQMAGNRRSVKLLQHAILALPARIGMLTAHRDPELMPEIAGERIQS